MRAFVRWSGWRCHPFLVKNAEVGGACRGAEDCRRDLRVTTEPFCSRSIATPYKRGRVTPGSIVNESLHMPASCVSTTADACSTSSSGEPGTGAEAAGTWANFSRGHFDAAGERYISKPTTRPGDSSGADKVNKFANDATGAGQRNEMRRGAAELVPPRKRSRRAPLHGFSTSPSLACISALRLLSQRGETTSSA